MMVNGKQIKIIKRGKRHERPATLTEQSEARTRNAADGAKRDAVAIVTGWVRELRQRKVGEAARGFERLFSEPATDATRS